MAEDSFADTPKSLSEIRAERAEDASLWSPRDALVEALRRLDRGEISPVMLTICWREPGKDRKGRDCLITCYSCSGPDKVHHIGMLERVKLMLFED